MILSKATRRNTSESSYGDNGMRNACNPKFQTLSRKVQATEQGKYETGGKAGFFFFLSHLLCLALNERLIQMSFILIHIK